MGHPHKRSVGKPVQSVDRNNETKTAEGTTGTKIVENADARTMDETVIAIAVTGTASQTDDASAIATQNAGGILAVAGTEMAIATVIVTESGVTVTAATVVTVVTSVAATTAQMTDAVTTVTATVTAIVTTEITGTAIETPALRGTRATATKSGAASTATATSAVAHAAVTSPTACTAGVMERPLLKSGDTATTAHRGIARTAAPVARPIAAVAPTAA